MPAQQLLATQDPGLMPWVPLTSIAGPPEPILQQCREVIDRAPVEERANLLAVTQVMAKLRYNDPRYLALFGGRQAMIESPLIQEIVAEAKAEANHTAILTFLRGRFGQVPPEIAQALQSISDVQTLEDLMLFTAQCPNLDAFRARVQA